MAHIHAVVWIDHHEARIYRFDDDVAVHTHHIIHSGSRDPAPVNHAYSDAIAADLGDARAILILGPSSAKHELYKQLEARHQALLERIVGLETVDHPGDGPLLAHAVKSFRAAARFGRPYSPEAR